MFNEHDLDRKIVTEIKWMISLTVHYKLKPNLNDFLESSSLALMYMEFTRKYSLVPFSDTKLCCKETSEFKVLSIS